MKTKTQNDCKQSTQGVGVTETRNIPEDVQDDLNLLRNRLPAVWNFKTEAVMKLKEEMNDLIIDFINKNFPEEEQQ